MDRWPDKVSNQVSREDNMSERPFVKEIDIETAGEFLDALSPRGPYFGEESDTGTWIFRGHSNSDYPLLPKVLRLPDRFNPEPVYLKGEWLRWFPIDGLCSTLMLAEYESQNADCLHRDRG